jgi:hypothetical protein
MTLRTIGGLLGAPAVGLMALVAALASALDGCTEGTTPDCSGNPSPCGYPQAPETDAADQAEGG